MRRSRPVVSRKRCGLVTTLHDGFVQIGDVGFPAVESDRDVTGIRIGFHVFHALDLHQRLAQLPHALVACGCDLDRLQNFVVGGVVKIAVIG